MDKEKQIKATDWLTKGYSEEELARMKVEAIKEADAELRNKQIAKRKQFSREIHNMTDTRLYNVWNNIKRRCYTKTNPSYKYYGGCGVGMCEEWRKSFSAFYEWSIKNGYNPNAPKGDCTIDRVDVKGDYEPSNCRWVSMKQQNLNRKANRIIQYNGETHTLVEWASILGTNYSTLLYRFRRGWSVEKAFNKEVLKNER